MTVLQQKRTEEELPTTYTVNYNYDDRRDRWNDGTSSYETHELQCNSMWGSPQPQLMYVSLCHLAFNEMHINDVCCSWSINREELDTRGNIFTIRDGKGVGAKWKYIV